MYLFVVSLKAQSTKSLTSTNYFLKNTQHNILIFKVSVLGNVSSEPVIYVKIDFMLFLQFWATFGKQ